MISVIVCHHLTENQPYLDLCLNSLMQSYGCEFEVICVSDAETKPSVPKDVYLHWDKNLYNSTKKVNHAITYLIDDRSDFLFFVSDDVMVSKYAMHALWKTAEAMNAIVAPFCNSENGAAYLTDIVIGGKNIPPALAIDDIKGLEEEILNVKGDKSFIIERQWCPFFAPMMSRDIWRNVGGIDEKLDCRFNDQDFCIRARQMGIMSLTQLGAFAIHFGSKTLSKSPSKAEDEILASKYFIQKHPGELK